MFCRARSIPLCVILLLGFEAVGALRPTLNATQCQPLTLSQFESIVSPQCLTGLAASFTYSIQTQLCVLLDNAIQSSVRTECCGACSSGVCDYSSECSTLDLTAADNVCAAAGFKKACVGRFSVSDNDCTVNNMPAFVLCAIPQCTDTDNQAIVRSFETEQISNGQLTCGTSNLVAFIVGFLALALVGACCCWYCSYKRGVCCYKSRNPPLPLLEGNNPVPYASVLV